MKKWFALTLALLMLLTSAVCVLPETARAADSGTISTTFRYSAAADALALAADTLNVPGQGNGTMTVYLTGNSGLTQTQASAVTASATNGATVSTEVVAVGQDVYAVAITVNANPVEFRNAFTLTAASPDGAINHTLDCSYGKTDETVYYEDINSYEGYREVNFATTEVTAYFRGADEQGLADANWTVLPLSMDQDVKYSTAVTAYGSDKHQIRVTVTNTAVEKYNSWNTFGFVDANGVLQATFMLAFKSDADPGAGGDQPGGGGGNQPGGEDDDPVAPPQPSGGTCLSGATDEVILDADQQRTYDIKLGVERAYIYYRGDGNLGMTQDEANKFTPQITAFDGINPKANFSYDVIPMEGESGLYQLRMTLEPYNVTCYSSYDLRIVKDGAAECEFTLRMNDDHFRLSRDVTIDGKTVRLAVARLNGTTKVEEDSLSTNIFQPEEEDGANYGAYHYVLGAFSGEKGDHENVAQEESWVYPYIKSIEVVQIANDKDNVMYLGTVYNDESEKRGFDVMRSISSGFIEVCVTVNFIDSLNMQPVWLTTRFTSHENRQTQVTIERPMDDTVEKLNQFLADYDYTKLQDDLFIKLAPITYTGTIVIPENACITDDGTEDGNWYHVFLQGQYGQNGERTTIRGTLELRGFSGHQSNISFVAPEKTNHKEETIAVKAVAPYKGGLALQGCSFTGYDIAVYCKGSYILPTEYNEFINNKIGLYIDAEGFLAPHDYKHLISNSKFRDNDIAIQIENLPENISTRNFRITKCDFVNNKKDIWSKEDRGYLYLFDNYYGEIANGSLHHRAPMYEDFHDKWLQVFPSFVSSVANLTDQDPLPARRVYNSAQKMALPLEGSTQGMSIDTASIQEDRTEPLTIDMMDEQDVSAATWTIAAPQQTTTFSRLRLTNLSTKVDGFVPYVEVSQGKNTASIRVTDSDALTTLRPMLSVVIRDRDDGVNRAKVTLNGLELLAQLDAATGTVSFLPACGGEYVITLYEKTPSGGDDPQPSGGTVYYPDYSEDDNTAEDTGTQTYRVSCRKLNVRSGAGLSYAKLTQLTRGATITGRLLDSGWLEFTLADGTTAYVYGKYAELANDGAEGAACCAGEGKVACRKLNVRSGPGADYDRVAQLRRGEPVKIIGCDSTHTWVLIELNGSKAWVCAKYISK